MRMNPVVMSVLLAGLLPLHACNKIEPVVCTADSECASMFGEGMVCSLDGQCMETIDENVCEVNADCTSKVGFGSYCNENAQCEDLPRYDRCLRSYPPDLLSNADRYRNFVVVGSLFDRSNPEDVLREKAAAAAVVVVNSGADFLDPDGNRHGFGLIACDIRGDDPAGDLDYSDSLQRSDAAEAAAEWLVDTASVPAILGPTKSSDVVDVFTEVVTFAKPQTMLISPAGIGEAVYLSDRSAPTDDDPGMLWRTAPSANSGAALFADEVAALESLELASGSVPVAIEHVVIVQESGPLGAGIGGSFNDAWTADPGRTATIVNFTSGSEASIGAAVAAVAAEAGLDAIVFGGDAEDASVFLEKIVAIPELEARTDLPLILPELGRDGDLFAAADAVVREGAKPFDYVFTSEPYVDTTTKAYQAYADEFSSLFPDDDPMGAAYMPHTYDAFYMVALGTAWAMCVQQHMDGESVARGMRHLTLEEGDVGHIQIDFDRNGWQAGMQQFRFDDHLDVDGASGPLEYDLATEELKSSVRSMLQATPMGDGFQVLGNFGE
jgi:branched-chain amino acid transport system substrate-binding protein